MPLGLQLLIAFALGGVLGWVFGWALGRGRGAAPDGRLEHELRQQLARRDEELNGARTELSSAQSALAGARADRAAAERLLAEQRTLHERILSDAQASQEKALADVREAFRALSAEALKQSAPEFLRLAEQSYARLQEAAKGDLDKRRESIKVLVEPLKQQLETYQRRLQQSEANQSATLGEVRQHLEALTQSSQSLAVETAQFRSVLKSNQARGRWGEETLRRVIEAAGMSAHCDFTEQVQSGDAKPDLLVRLPGERMILVDAKVPDLDFLSAIDTADPAQRTAALATHATRLKATIKALADRDYPREFPNALDYVVLFLPAESLFSAALEGDRELIVWAAQKRILLATPASLIALLRSVSVSWQQQAQTENTRAIAQSAQELYQRVTKFTEHFERIRAGLDRANQAYNDALGSYERMVRPAGERLQKLSGVSSVRELADIDPLPGGLRNPES